MMPAKIFLRVFSLTLDVADSKVTVTYNMVWKADIDRGTPDLSEIAERGGISFETSGGPVFLRGDIRSFFSSLEELLSRDGLDLRRNEIRSLACSTSNGEAELIGWKLGSILYNMAIDDVPPTTRDREIVYSYFAEAPRGILFTLVSVHCERRNVSNECAVILEREAYSEEDFTRLHSAVEAIEVHDYSDYALLHQRVYSGKTRRDKGKDVLVVARADDVSGTLARNLTLECEYVVTMAVYNGPFSPTEQMCLSDWTVH